MLGDVDECLPNDRMKHAGHPGDRRARVAGHHKIGLESIIPLRLPEQRPHRTRQVGRAVDAIAAGED